MSNALPFLNAALTSLFVCLMFFIVGAAVTPKKWLSTPFLLASLPLVGFGFIAVIASNIGLITGLNKGLVFTTGLLLCVLVLVARKSTLLASARWLGVLFVGALFVTVVGHLPLLKTSDSMLLQHPTTNHDAFFYASHQSWVENRPYWERPVLLPGAPEQSDPPGVASAVVVDEFNVRSGDALVGAVLNSVLQGEVSTNWYSTRVAWLWVAFSAFLTSSILLGLNRAKAMLGALLAAASWQTVFQMYNQNAPAIVGLALLSLCIAIPFSLTRDETQSTTKAFLFSLVIASLIITYSELLPFAAIFSFAATKFSSLRNKASVYRLFSGSVMGLAVSPYATYEAYRTITRVSTLSNALGEPLYWGRPIDLMVASLFGINYGASYRNLAIFAVAMAFFVGLVAFSFLLRTVVPVVVVLVGTLVWFHLGSSGAYYSLDRLVQTFTPVVMWLSVIGLLSLHGGGIAARFGSGLLVSSTLLMTTIAPFQFVSQQGSFDWRSIDKAVLRLLDLPQTREMSDELMIATSRYVDRLWITNHLVDRKHVEYAFLTTDYFYGISEFDDRKPDRWLLTNIVPVGSGFASTGAASGYQVLDMSRSTAALLTPTRQDMSQDLTGVVTGRGVPHVKLLVWGNTRVQVSMSVDGVDSFRTRLNGSWLLNSGEMQSGRVVVSLPPGSHDLAFASTSVTADVWTIAVTKVQDG